MTEWVIHIPGDDTTPARWAKVFADSREAALQQVIDSKVPGWDRAVIEGHTDPGDHAGFIGWSTFNWLRDNPDRLIDINVSSNPELDKPENSGTFGVDDLEVLMGDELNRASAFRNFLRSQQINPTSALGRAASEMFTNKVGDLLTIAEAGGLNIADNATGSYSRPSASAFLENQGLEGIARGAANVVNALAGGGQIGGTEAFRRPASQQDNAATEAQRVLIAALAKNAPHFAMRHGARAVSDAASEFFDARHRGELGDIDVSQATDENLIRFVRDRLGSQLFG